MSNAPLALRVKPRPGSVSVQRGVIIINCLRIVNLPQTPFWHYDKFKDPDVRAATKWIIFDRLKQQNTQIFFPLVLYDGNKNMFSVTKLDLQTNPAEFTVSLEYPRKTYRLDIKLVNVIQPLELQKTTSTGGSSNQRLVGVTLMNVLVRSYAAGSAGISIKGRGFYSSVGRSQAGALEFWRGIISSVRPAIGNYLINLDTSVAPMYPEGSLLDALKEFNHMRSIRDLHAIAAPNARRQQRDSRKFLKGLKVTLKHQKGNIIKKISDVEWTSAERYEFDMEGEIITVKDYFYRKNITLSYPALPIMAKIGKTAVLPLELLSIVAGQPYRGVIPENLAPGFLTFATQRPNQRLNSLRSSLQTLGLDYLPQTPQRHRSPYLHQAGMRVENEFMQVQARVLPPPTLQARGVPITGNAKAGSWNMTNHRVSRPAEIRYLALVLATGVPNSQEYAKTVDQMIGIWHQMGIRIGPEYTKIKYYQAGSYEALQNVLLKDVAREAPQYCTRHGVEYRGHALVVIFVANSAKPMREGPKYWGDVVTGYATQVLKASKLLGRGFDQYARNVGLKVNAKMSYLHIEPRPNDPSKEKICIMSGVAVDLPNINAEITRDNTMIMGLDTSHPLSGSQFPTIAAMVFSIDSELAQYRGRVAYQRPRQEIISNLGTWTKDAMTAHQRVPKRQKPDYAKRVIVYRDGVSEGQFQQVLKEEVAAIREALAEITIKAKLSAPPRLTFIVVGKKHHIRFLPNPASPMADKNENSVPGTVVDTDITTLEPNLFDFYLQSHGSLLGTSRPAHYSVLYDESGFSADDLEKFSHDLCHVYQIATRSVSIPAPVYYADKLAGRSPILFHDIHNNLDNASRVTDEMSYEEWEGEFHRAQIHPQAKERMFWL